MVTVGSDRLNDAITSIGASENGEIMIREEYNRLVQEYKKQNKKVHIFWDEDDHYVSFEIAGVGCINVYPRIENPTTEELTNIVIGTQNKRKK